MAGFNAVEFAGQLYRDELAANGRRHYADAARAAFEQAAAFLRVAKQHDPQTAERRFEGQDVPEARGLAVEVAGGR